MLYYTYFIMAFAGDPTPFLSINLFDLLMLETFFHCDGDWFY